MKLPARAHHLVRILVLPQRACPGPDLVEVAHEIGVGAPVHRDVNAADQANRHGDRKSFLPGRKNFRLTWRREWVGRQIVGHDS